jgi:rod shape-determining protein MreC
LSLRDGPFGDIRVPLTWSAAAALVIAAIIGGALLLSDRRETMKAEAYDTARHAVDVVASPVGGALSAPVRWTHAGLDTVRGYFFAVSENRKLKAQLAADQALRDQAQALEVENQRYRALLGVRTDPPLPHVFARTVSDARGPFANTRLADVGADKGVQEGNPVLSERGVVGRVVGISDHVSRIMLLTDVESRTPILIVRTNGRAILSGDGGPSPKLDYIRGAPLKEGDRVLTSGDGGVFPRGLPIGTVVKGFDGQWRIALDSDASPIDDVQILLFKDFSQLVDDQALAPRQLPTAMTEEPSQSIVGAAPAAPHAPAAPRAPGAAPTPAKPGAAATPAKPGTAPAGAAAPSSALKAPTAKAAKPSPDKSATSAKPAKPTKPAAVHAKPAEPAKPTPDHTPSSPPADEGPPF